MTHNPSLRRRIVFRLTLVTIVLSAIGYAFLATEFSSVATGMKNSTLYEEAEDIYDHAKFRKDGTLDLTFPDKMKAQFENNSHRFAILTPDHRILAQSPTQPASIDSVALMHPGSDLPVFEDLVGVYELPTDVRRSYLYGAVTQETIDGHPVLIQVERITNRFNLLSRTLLDEFFEEGAWLGIPFLLTLMIASILTVTQTLAPLQIISRRARRIGPANPSERLSLDNVPVEVTPLVRAVNGALDRMEKAIESQRDLTADAAHELRTPLAILRSRIDMLPSGPDQAALQKNIDVMGRIVEQLLKMAQLDSATVGDEERADLVQIARDASMAMAPVAIEADLDLELIAPDHPVAVRGQSETLFHAVRNLIENAIKYAPVKSTITIRVEAGPPPTIMVADHGPGVPLDLRDKIFTRFWQGDQHKRQRRSDTTGAGLGLAIVARAMTVHGGSVGVSDTPGGGATLSLRFPALAPMESQAV